MSLGKNIENLRKSFNLSRPELGNRMGISDKTIWSWEADRTEPSIEHLIKLADIFGVTIDELACSDIIVPTPIVAYNGSTPLKQEISELVTNILNKVDNEERLNALKSVLESFYQTW